MKINVAKTGAENILDLVLDANPGLSLTATQFTLGNPSAFVGTGGRNTQVTLTAVEGEGKTGSKTIDYTRLNPVTGPNAGQAVTGVEVALDATDVQVKAILVALFGLVAADVTVADLVLPVDVDTDGSITLAAATDSLLYVGSTSVVLKAPVEDLSGIEGQMNGFEPEA